ncbi:MAG: tRNA lysidine(34) synthetase TilS, partial [Candidatus Limosilactobacillus intestinavium]
TVFNEDRLKLREYQKCVPVLRRWLLRMWLNQHHWYNVSLLELKQADHWLMNQQKPTGEYQVGTAVQLIKNYSNVQLQKVQKSAKKNVKITDFMVEFDHWYTETNGDCFGVFSQPVGKVQAKVWLTDNQLPLRVRTWRLNDEVRLKNGHHQKVRRILIDQKVPQPMRPLQLVVVDRQDQVLWAVNRKTAWLDRRVIRDQDYQEWYFCQKRDTGENDE